MNERIRDAHVERYVAILTEPHRPPSRGGNTKARHSHALVIAGEKYWFIAPGSKKWVFKQDTVSFEFKREGAYLEIVPGTLDVRDRDGKPVSRGLREPKAQLRTATTRLPVSKRESRD